MEPHCSPARECMTSQGKGRVLALIVVILAACAGGILLAVRHPRQALHASSVSGAGRRNGHSSSHIAGARMVPFPGGVSTAEVTGASLSLGDDLAVSLKDGTIDILGFRGNHWLKLRSVSTSSGSAISVALSADARSIAAVLRGGRVVEVWAAGRDQGQLLSIRASWAGPNPYSDAPIAVSNDGDWVAAEGGLLFHIRATGIDAWNLIDPIAAPTFGAMAFSTDGRHFVWADRSGADVLDLRSFKKVRIGCNCSSHGGQVSSDARFASWGTAPAGVTVIRLVDRAVIRAYVGRGNVYGTGVSPDAGVVVAGDAYGEVAARSSRLTGSAVTVAVSHSEPVVAVESDARGYYSLAFVQNAPGAGPVLSPLPTLVALRVT
jgi:hypothetical protein